jgi:hypothetical protein
MALSCSSLCLNHANKVVYTKNLLSFWDYRILVSVWLASPKSLGHWVTNWLPWQTFHTCCPSLTLEILSMFFVALQGKDPLEAYSEFLWTLSMWHSFCRFCFVYFHCDKSHSWDLLISMTMSPLSESASLRIVLGTPDTVISESYTI